MLYAKNYFVENSIKVNKYQKPACPPNLHATRDCGALPDRVVCGDWKCVDEGYFPPAAKPVVYLYPTHKEDILVKLDYAGEIIADYPAFDPRLKGWKVTAFPDGRIINQADGLEYSYIFWEGTPAAVMEWDLRSGFVVKGSNTREFLQKTLSEMGLTPKEYNEFIVYWYPLLKDNPYNLIHFAESQYTDIAELTVTPDPDSLLRVFMVAKPLNEKVEIQTQPIKPFERKGFAVVEWGGTLLKQ